MSNLILIDGATFEAQPREGGFDVAWVDRFGDKHIINADPIPEPRLEAFIKQAAKDRRAAMSQEDFCDDD